MRIGGLNRPFPLQFRVKSLNPKTSWYAGSKNQEFIPVIPPEKNARRG